MKTCSKCKIKKDLIEFGKNKLQKDGYHYYCKECNNSRRRKKNGHYWKLSLKNNNEKYCPTCNTVKSLNDFSNVKRNLDGKYGLCKLCKSLTEKNHRQKLKDFGIYKIKKHKEYIKNIETYKLYTKNKIRDYKDEYKKILKKEIDNPIFKLKNIIRSLILVSIKRNGYKKKSRTHEILGCDFETFKAHLEKQFVKGMNWNNHGEWHLDHIYPISLAKDEQHLIELNHYTNFQPLWAIDNIKKSNKIIEKQLFLL